MSNNHKPVRFAAIGLDHRHIYGQSANMQAVGGEFVGWWTEGDPGTLDGFDKRFPGVPRVENKQELLEDSSIDLILIAAIPADRAKLAIEAMEHGKLGIKAQAIADQVYYLYPHAFKSGI